MTYPDFFNKIPTIKLQDELSNVLGAFDDGIIEFSYLDIVKSAGHSCPTVLGAYLMTYKGLKALYNEDTPSRGKIKVEFKERQNEGVSGVIASVVSNITGATFDTGFKGLGGRFDRRFLMYFEKSIESNMRFTRIDTQKSVDLFYDPSMVRADTKMQILMQKAVSKQASNDELKEFGKLWQKRVEEIALRVDEVVKVSF